MMKLRLKIFRLNIDFNHTTPKSSVRELVVVAYNEAKAREMAAVCCAAEGVYIWRNKRLTACVEVGNPNNAFHHPQILCKYVA